MAAVDTIDITKLLMVEQGSTPSNPAAGKQKLYVRSSDHVLCLVDSSGTVLPLNVGAFPDHTHAATGSGANGGGSTLSPVTLNVPQSSPGTTEGRVGWSTAYHALLGYDTVQAKALSPVGFAPFVAHPAMHSVIAFTSSRVLAAVSGGNADAILTPIFAPTPFFPYDFSIISNDTATARSAEIRLYADILGNANALSYVANTAATFSFTPSAASVQRSTTITGAGLLPAGWYYAVLRNTHATSTFSIGINAGSATLTLANYGSLFLTTASVAALGTTHDITVYGSSGSPTIAGIGIRCLVAGVATPAFA